MAKNGMMACVPACLLVSCRKGRGVWWYIVIRFSDVERVRARHFSTFARHLPRGDRTLGPASHSPGPGVGGVGLHLMWRSEAHGPGPFPGWTRLGPSACPVPRPPGLLTTPRPHDGAVGRGRSRCLCTRAVGGQSGAGCIGRGAGAPPPPLQGAQPMPSPCPPDGKCQFQWHLYPTVTAPNRFGNLVQPPLHPLLGLPLRPLPL